MGTTKRTTANIARDTNNQKIRLLKSKISDGCNSLTYGEISYAVKFGTGKVTTQVRYSSDDFGYYVRDFGKTSFRQARLWTLDSERKNLDRTETYFRIGCHFFTLKMFNRILRAPSSYHETADSEDLRGGCIGDDNHISTRPYGRPRRST